MAPDPIALSDTEQSLLAIARRVAMDSPDLSRKVGAVLVDAEGFILAAAPNTLPEGIEIEPWMLERPHKYDWTEHAERNAIFEIARSKDKSTHCATVVLPWFPCKDCARSLVGAGITRVLAPYPDVEDPNWGEGFKTALKILGAAKVQMDFFEDDMGHHARPRADGDPAPTVETDHLLPIADVVAHWNAFREVRLEHSTPRAPKLK